MICEKCGSNNPKNTVVCAKCGANMPVTEMCGGFGDILSYEGPATVANTAASSGVDENVVRNLEKKLNVAVETQRKLKIVTVISLAFSLILLVCFIFTSCISCGKIKDIDKGNKNNGPSTDNQSTDSLKKSDFEQNEGSSGYIFSEVIEGIESIFN